jgi:hypothetical protein
MDAASTTPRFQPGRYGGVLMQRLVRHWRRNRLAREIKKDRRYFQPLGNGWWTTNRLMWQIKLLLSKPEK